MEVAEIKEDKIKEIRTGYQKIVGKSDFIMEVALDVGRAKGTIKNHWLSGLWDIPSEFQVRVLDLINNKIKNQNHEKSI